LFIVFGGGQWLWPGIAPLFERVGVNFGDGQSLTLKKLSLVLLVITIDGFLSNREAERVIAASSPHTASAINDDDTARGASVAEFRTPETHWLERSDVTPWLQTIDSRVANLSRPTAGVAAQESAQASAPVWTMPVHGR
jgi:hypothetical protein